MGFIDRHGYVRYPVRQYRTEGPCEVPGCTERRDQMTEVDRLFNLKYPWPGTIQRRESGDKFFGNPPLRGMHAFEIDHCHRHGWVRGIICRSCNNMLPLIEQGKSRGLFNDEYALGEYGITLTVPDFNSYLLNCPECAGLPAPAAVIITSEYLIPDSETTRRAKTCPVCLGDADAECGRCGGTGRVPDHITGNCEGCGRQRKIADEVNGWCRECLKERSYTEADFCLTHGGDCEGFDGFGCMIVTA